MNIQAFGFSGNNNTEFSLFSQTNAVTIENTTNELPFTSTGSGSLTIPSLNFKAGSALKITALGIHSASGNPTLNIKVKLNSTIMLTTGAIACGNSTNALFEIRAFITCYSIGTTGVFWAQGKYQEDGGGANSFQMVNTNSIAVDTTINQTLSITAQWGTASNNNSTKCTNLFMEMLKP